MTDLEIARAALQRIETLTAALVASPDDDTDDAIRDEIYAAVAAGMNGTPLPEIDGDVQAVIDGEEWCEDDETSEED